MKISQTKPKEKLIGFSNGISQPSREISLRLSIPQNLDFKNIDFWLENAFEIKIEYDRDFSFLTNPTDEVYLCDFSNRILALANTFLQSIRIPSFAQGKVLSLSQDPDMPKIWTVVLLIPYVQHTNQTVYKFAYQVAIDILKMVSAKKYNQTNLDEVFHFFEQSFEKKFQASNFGGESTIPLLKSAWLKKIDFRHLGNGSYLLGLGANSVLVDKGAIQSDSAIGARISNNKWLTASYLNDAGLPAATHVRVNSTESIEQIGNQLGWPLVVKPLDRDRGEGVVVNINNLAQLKDSVLKALNLSSSALIEKQVLGICHRILVVNGKIRIAAKRLPKSVKGDGEKSVRQLVELANLAEALKPPWSRLKPFPLDDLAQQTLASKNLHLDTVPSKGEFVPLRPIQTSEWGGVIENFFDKVHPDNARIAIHAAELFGLSIAGIDIISSDITKPWYENGAIINEVNFSPLLSGRADSSVLDNILDEIISDNGKIPIEVFVGDDSALQKAKDYQFELSQKGRKFWLTSDKLTLTPDGIENHLTVDGLFMRCSALLLNRQVEGLLVVIQNDELLRTGLPFQHINCLHQVLSSAQQVSDKARKKDPHDWIEKVSVMINEFIDKY
jgi:cyanophycin synthetase